MTDTTTIEITDEQSDVLDGLKEHPKESKKAVLQRLIDSYNDERDEDDGPAVEIDALVDELVDELGATAGGPQVDDSEMARAVVAQFDYAELASRTADELEGRMR